MKSSSVSLTDLAVPELEALAQELGEPSFAGRNLGRWVYQRRARSFAAMTDLSRSFRERLEERTVLRQLAVDGVRADAGGTVAFLLRLRDGQKIETVLIPEDGRQTVCVSTQVGCAVRCVFCASGLEGLRRNLSAGEIAEQVLVAQDHLGEEQRVSNVVVMGIGEPAMNAGALVRALTIWNDPRGLALGARRITVSTVGYPAKIDRLAGLQKEFGLAVSLHAPRQELRERLLPGTRGIPLDEVLAAARRYFDATGRRVTFEYVLLEGLNAGPEEARDLARLLRGFPCIVNLIPVNPVDGLGFRRPPAASIRAFRETLEGAGITVTQRKTRGDGIAAACGQLRLRDERATAPGG